MRVEEDVSWCARRIVDGSARDDHQGRRTRELNADIHVYLRVSGNGNGGHQQHHKDQSLHRLAVRFMAQLLLS
jgi:hypothetical protein